MSVLIVTSVGELVVDLHTDLCPRTTANFLKLSKMKYYDGCLFHNVLHDFVAQTGDRTGTGNGGDPLYKFLYGDQSRFFVDEIRPELNHSKKGTVAMASSGNASQFYITLRSDLQSLDDGQHTVFGTVAEGFDTLEKINESYVDGNRRPYKNIRIKHTFVLYVPDELAELVAEELVPAELVPENYPSGKPKDETAEERLEDNWVPLDETLDPVQLDKITRSKEARSNAVILEIIGDIPGAEVKPPDNVLFVCNLNPITRDEDLYTIFSRFGTVTSAEIVCDYKTGDSLGYAFVEFETKKACEHALEKTNNCMVDDRRIHVDFSQSVSKIWGQFRQDRRNTGRKKIQKLDDWRSEPPHKGDRDRKGRHDNRDYSMHRSRSRDQELISTTGIMKDDDNRRKGDRRKREESCHRRSSRC